MSIQVFQVLVLQDYLLKFLHTSKFLVSTIGFHSIVFLATCYLDSFKQKKNLDKTIMKKKKKEKLLYPIENDSVHRRRVN